MAACLFQTVCAKITSVSPTACWLTASASAAPSAPVSPSTVILVSTALLSSVGFNLGALTSVGILNKSASYRVRGGYVTVRNELLANNDGKGREERFFLVF